MSRVASQFERIRANRSKALITYVTAGDPDIETTVHLVLGMEKSGADIVELGVPFSDPLADGATIQRASQRALQKGITLSNILQAVADIRKQSSVPVVLMSYYNPILRYGIEAFVDDATKSGVDGLILPDLPPEEAGEMLEASRSRDFDLIFLLAPTSTVERIKLVSQHSEGFIYCVSLTGVTGVRNGIVDGLSDFIGTVRRYTDKPLAVGFGISTAEQARQVAKVADGVIVGSALVNIVERHTDPQLMIEEVKIFVKIMKKRVV